MEENQEKTPATGTDNQSAAAPAEYQQPANATATAKDEGKDEGAERRFSQADVDRIVKERLSKAKENEESLNQRIAKLEEENRLNRVNSALSSAGISPDKREDVIFYMKGKGVEISEETLSKELERHPHWKQAEAKEEPKPAKSASVPPSAGNGKSADKSTQGSSTDKYRGLFGL